MQLQKLPGELWHNVSTKLKQVPQFMSKYYIHQKLRVSFEFPTNKHIIAEKQKQESQSLRTGTPRGDYQSN